MRSPIIIKKSPIAIVKNFLLLQSAAVAAFFIASTSAHYAKIYRSLPFSDFISFHIAEALFIFLIETGIVFFIFFRWYRESYQVRNGEVIHARGVLYRNRMTIPLENIASVTHNQSPLGKLTRYGTVRLVSIDKQRILFKDIPEPQEYVDLLLRLKREFAGQKNKFEDITGDKPDITALINRDEHENLEFKSTFRWDVRQNTVNRALEKSVMKTIAAFLNSQGGHLVIGVDDNKSVVGLASDFGSLNRKDTDGFENHFTNIFHSMLGGQFRQFVKLNWSHIDGKECCVVSVAPSQKPAYLKSDNNGEEFFIRTGNGTTALKLSEANAYIDSRWGRF